MTKQFLHHPKVRAAFQHMRRSRVPQSMRSNIGRTRHRSNEFVYHRAHPTRVDPTTTCSQKQGIPAGGCEQLSTHITPPG